MLITAISVEAQAAEQGVQFTSAPARRRGHRHHHQVEEVAAQGSVLKL
ncbi:MAG: hypothetical protein U0P45_15900 [Acidimicrobiales bacterium]